MTVMCASSGKNITNTPGRTATQASGASAKSSLALAPSSFSCRLPARRLRFPSPGIGPGKNERDVDMSAVRFKSGLFLAAAGFFGHDRVTTVVVSFSCLPTGRSSRSGRRRNVNAGTNPLRISAYFSEFSKTSAIMFMLILSGNTYADTRSRESALANIYHADYKA